VAWYALVCALFTPTQEEAREGCPQDLQFTNHVFCLDFSPTQDVIASGLITGEVHVYVGTLLLANFSGTGILSMPTSAWLAWTPFTTRLVVVSTSLTMAAVKQQLYYNLL
jgi:hypothetical protein